MKNLVLRTVVSLIIFRFLFPSLIFAQNFQWNKVDFLSESMVLNIIMLISYLDNPSGCSRCDVDGSGQAVVLI